MGGNLSAGAADRMFKVLSVVEAMRNRNLSVPDAVRFAFPDFQRSRSIHRNVVYFLATGEVLPTRQGGLRAWRSSLHLVQDDVVQRLVSICRSIADVTTGVRAQIIARTAFINKRKKQPGEVPPRPVTAAWLAAIANDELLPRSVAAARARAKANALAKARAGNLTAEETAAAVAKAESSVPADHISTTTARRWLRACGFKYFVRAERGLYIDGHERPDVIIDRRRFLAKFLPLVQTMELSWLDNGAWSQNAPSHVERLYIWISEDEAMVYRCCVFIMPC